MNALRGGDGGGNVAVLDDVGVDNKTRDVILRFLHYTDNNNLRNVKFDDFTFHIQGWRWHFMSLIRDSRRLERLSSHLTNILADETLDDDCISESAAGLDALHRAANYVINFNMAGLYRIQSGMFLSFLRDHLCEIDSLRSISGGGEGQDVTAKFVGSKLVPQTVDGLGSVVQIVGEVCAPKHIENARNYAAGALNLKDVEEFRTRAVEFFAYGIEPSQFATYNEDMKWLKRLGFNTVKDPELHNIYPCDGVVYRVNSNVLYMAMGYTSKHPKGAYALKERQEAVETQILAVEWQVGKTGKVTPVAILEPVMIGDATVSRATLNNVGFIEALGIEIGDTVAIVRSGEIIPRILHKVDA